MKVVLSPKPIYNIHNPIGIKFLTRLCLGPSHLREHKFNHNFEDCINPLCSCSLESESLIPVTYPGFFWGYRFLKLPVFGSQFYFIYCRFLPFLVDFSSYLGAKVWAPIPLYRYQFPTGYVTGYTIFCVAIISVPFLQPS